MSLFNHNNSAVIQKFSIWQEDEKDFLLRDEKDFLLRSPPSSPSSSPSSSAAFITPTTSTTPTFTIMIIVQTTFVNAQSSSSDEKFTTTHPTVDLLREDKSISVISDMLHSLDVSPDLRPPLLKKLHDGVQFMLMSSGRRETRLLLQEPRFNSNSSSPSEGILSPYDDNAIDEESGQHGLGFHHNLYMGALIDVTEFVDDDDDEEDVMLVDDDDAAYWVVDEDFEEEEGFFCEDEDDDEAYMSESDSEEEEEPVKDVTLKMMTMRFK